MPRPSTPPTPWPVSATVRPGDDPTRADLPRRQLAGPAAHGHRAPGWRPRSTVGPAPGRAAGRTGSVCPSTSATGWGPPLLGAGRRPGGSDRLHHGQPLQAGRGRPGGPARAAGDRGRPPRTSRPTATCSRAWPRPAAPTCGCSATDPVEGLDPDVAGRRRRRATPPWSACPTSTTARPPGSTWPRSARWPIGPAPWSCGI